MYLVLLTVGLCLAYPALHALYSLFFEGKLAPMRSGAAVSVLAVACFSLAVFFVSAAVPDAETSNRILHVFGGGFLAFAICFLVVRDAGLRIGRFRFLVFSFLVVMALGVANEILEYFLQTYFRFGFARDVDDTWLDLVSNVVGAAIAAAIFTPLVDRETRR